MVPGSEVYLNCARPTILCKVI